MHKDELSIHLTERFPDNTVPSSARAAELLPFST